MFAYDARRFAWNGHNFYWNNQQTVFWNSTQDSGICLVYFNSPVSQLMQFPGLNSCCMMVRHLNTPNHNRIIEKWFVAASGCLHVVFFQLVYWNQIPFIWGFPNYVVHVSLRRPNPQNAIWHSATLQLSVNLMLGHWEGGRGTRKNRKPKDSLYLSMFRSMSTKRGEHDIKDCRLCVLASRALNWWFCLFVS